MERTMALAIEILDVLFTLAAVMIVSRIFRNADRVPGDEERNRKESERAIAQIEAYLDQDHRHRTRWPTSK